MVAVTFGGGTARTAAAAAGPARVNVREAVWPVVTCPWLSGEGARSCTGAALLRPAVSVCVPSVVLRGEVSW